MSRSVTTRWVIERAYRFGDVLARIYPDGRIVLEGAEDVTEPEDEWDYFLSWAEKKVA